MGKSPLNENSSSLSGSVSVRSAMVAIASSSVGRSSFLTSSSNSRDFSQIIFNAFINEGLLAEQRSFFSIFCAVFIEKARRTKS